MLKKPIIDDSAYINKLAYVAGDVQIDKDANIWAGASLRGDVNYIKIGQGSNVQDNATVHVSYDFPTIIGKNVTIGHNAIVHGATIKDNVMVGMGAIVLDGAVVESNTIIGAGALIPNNKIIPAGSVVIGSPYKILRQASPGDVKHIQDNAQTYCRLAAEYKKLNL